MRHTIKSLGVTTLLIYTLSISALNAQESVSATGGNTLGSGGTITFSMGQVAYQTHTGTNGSLAEGVQQPLEISVETATIKVKGINLAISVFPNPTSNNLTMRIDNSEKTSHDFSLLSYQLYDMSGKLLQSEKIKSSQTSIDMNELVPATYYVKVIVQLPGKDSQKIKTFKIVKNQ